MISSQIRVCARSKVMVKIFDNRILKYRKTKYLDESEFELKAGNFLRIDQGLGNKKPLFFLYFPRIFL